jgi:hypothetical protein
MLKIIIEIYTVDMEIELEKKAEEKVCPVHGVAHKDMVGAGAISLHTVEKDATTTEKAVSLVIMKEMKTLLDGLSRSTIHSEKMPPAVSDN